MRRWTLIVLCLMLVFGCACAPSTMTTLEATASTPTASPASTPSATPETTVTVTPTIAPPATVSPKPTVMKIDSTPMIVKGKEKAIADLNQRFQDFLLGEGQFSEEEIIKNLFVSPFDANVVDLGCNSGLPSISVFSIQGVVLHYEITAYGEVFAFGTKGKKGDRMIIMLEVPTQSLVNNNCAITFQVFPTASQGSSSILLDFHKRDYSYYEFLNRYLNKSICLDIDTQVSLELEGYNSIPENVKKVYIESIDPKIDVNCDLMTNIFFVDSKDHQLLNNYEQAKYFFQSTAEPIITVTTYDEFQYHLSNEYDQIPSCISILVINTLVNN